MKRKPFQLETNEADDNPRDDTIGFYYHGLSNLFWPEKVVLLLDVLQMFGILWISAQPWPWPFLWSHWSRWLVFANLDGFSMTPTGALAGATSNIGISRWGNLDGYVYYACYFVVFQTVVVGVAASFFWKLGSYGQNWERHRPKVVAILLSVLYVMYCPVTLAVFRLYYCDSDSGALSADPNVSCSNPSYFAITVICSLLHWPVVIGLPVAVYRYIKSCVVFSFPPDHEKCIQSWELLFMFQVDDRWLTNQIWLTASFRLSGAYFRFYVILLKLCLVTIFISFRFSLPLQAVLIWFCFAVFFGYSVYSFPYRCATSNMMLLMLLALLVIDSSFGVANSLGVSNAIMVSSVESLWLLGSNVIGFAVVVVVLLFAALTPTTDWPTNKTLHRIVDEPRLRRHVRKWILMMRTARKVLRGFTVTVDEMANVDDMEEVIRELRSCWVESRNSGSIFTFSLGELLEELLGAHSLRKSRLLRNDDDWNAEVTSGKAQRIFSRRHDKWLLMAPHKRRILIKLLAMRTILDRKRKADPVEDLEAGLAAERQELLRASSRILNDEDSDSSAGEVHLAEEADLLFGDEEAVDHLAEAELMTQERNRRLADAISIIENLEEQSESVLNDVKKFQEMNREELEDIIFMWNDIIRLVEEQNLANFHENVLFHAKRIENWYIYRQALVERMGQLRV